MKLEINRIFWLSIFGIILSAGCAVPQHFWPQKDIVKSDMNTIPGQRTVLIASRASEYKKLLVSELQKQLSAAHISHMTIGVKQLDKVDPSDYAAVVVINTCLAWGLDHEVRAFLESQKTTNNILLLTTSGDGSWLPDKRGRDFDAISGASIKANVSDVARHLLEKIQQRL
ncbi:MAG: hypothetical protein P8X96_23170 [Desulfobacteraceae bacterium]